MSIFGIILILLAAPLLIVYAIQEKEKKNKTWLRLGLIMGGIGLILLLFGR